MPVIVSMVSMKLLGCLALLSSLPTPAAAAEECTISLPPGIHRIPLDVGSRQRHFLAVVPSGPRPQNKLVPAMIDWHGFSESAYCESDAPPPIRACTGRGDGPSDDCKRRP
eukprot:SAG22_NODE_1983_length_3206_cov_3.243000_3_plen_111_part_00